MFATVLRDHYNYMETRLISSSSLIHMTKAGLEEFHEFIVSRTK